MKHGIQMKNIKKKKWKEFRKIKQLIYRQEFQKTNV